MNDPILNRRDVNRLTLAALGGLAAGLLPGCGPCGNGPPPAAGPAAKDKGDDNIPLLLHDPHVCRGVNTCKGKGKDGKNDCAGQGHCATVAPHSCQGSNDCKGHGGCDDHPGENECSGKGDCAVPLSVMKFTWHKARIRFEELMPKYFPDKKVGPFPPES